MALSRNSSNENEKSRNRTSLGASTPIQLGKSRQISMMMKGVLPNQSHSIGLPENVKHNLHVDLDYNWTGEDPSNAFKILKKLGEGAHGSVYKALHQETGLILAIKKVKLIGQKIKSDIKKEIDLLKKCRQNNIVSYYGCCFYENELWILMDFCSMGSVLDLIGNEYEDPSKSIRLNEGQIASILCSVLKGLIYLHSNGITHRDIKCANVLLNDKAETKIADFGVAEQFATGAQSGLSVMGTPLWMAPEVITGQQKMNSSSDIWALGITAIEMVQGKPPYEEEHLMRALYRIGTESSPTLKEASKYSREFNDFIRCCLNKEYSARPSAADLIMHPFIINTAQASNTIFKELIENHKSIKEEEDSINELWSITIKANEITLRKSVTPGMSCGEVAQKVAKRFPNMDEVNCGLYLISKNVWLEDSKKIFFYKKYLRDPECILELKSRSESFRTNTSPRTPSASPHLSPTISMSPSFEASSVSRNTFFNSISPVSSNLPPVPIVSRSVFRSASTNAVELIDWCDPIKARNAFEKEQERSKILEEENIKLKTAILKLKDELDQLGRMIH